MPATRRYDLDWLRIGAFALLILYHIGMVFVPWGYHIKTAHPARWVEVPMLLLNAWRLPLLFVIAGAASRFLLARSSGAGAFAGGRSRRLLLPLLFGVAVVVPPQAWVDVVVNHGYARGFAAFWSGDYWRFDGALGVIVPTYNHLWFVAYLWLYTMAFAALAAVAPARTRAALQRGFDRAFGGWRLVVVPVLGFWAARMLLADRFPETHALTDDWHMHLVYFAAFAFGAMLARSARSWATIARVWPYAAAAAVIGWGAVVWGNFRPDTPLPVAVVAAARLARTVQMWGAIVALLGVAQRFWNRDHPLRATLNEAVFPAYIAHQTIIVVGESALRPYRLPGSVEFAVLLVATVAGCALFYLGGRRVGWLRPLIGLAPQPSAPSWRSSHALRPTPPA